MGIKNDDKKERPCILFLNIQNQALKKHVLFFPHAVNSATETNLPKGR